MSSGPPKRQTAWDRADQHRSQSTQRPRGNTARRSTPRLKAHFPQLVYYVYQSRYAAGDQVRARFPDVFAGDHTGRTTRRHLKQLVDMGYLATADVRFTGPTAPLVYICTGRGTSFLRRHFGFELVEAREESKSIPSIEHELMLTEFELATWQTVRARRDLSLHFTERRYFHASKQLKHAPGSGRRLIPDAGCLLAVNRGGEPPGLLLYFAEMDNGTEAPGVVLQKFQHYDIWAQSRLGQQALIDTYRQFNATNPRPNFRLLVIARRRGTVAGQDARRLADLFVQSLELTEAMQRRMYFTTADVLKEHQHEPTPLAAPIWLKTADAAAWLPHYRSMVAALDTSQGHKPSVHKREYVTERFATMSRHAMFPREASPGR